MSTETPEDTLVRVLHAACRAKASPPRARYALGVVAPGAPLQFVCEGLVRHAWQLTPDVDRAHRWESVDAVMDWIKSTPDDRRVGKGADGRPKELPSALDRLRGKDLFVFRVKVEAERLVAAWRVADRPAMAGAAAGSEKGGNGDG